jgi:DNA-directed RNA polymerase I subunit RPA49
MLAFRVTAKGKIDKPKLYEKLSNIPTVVVDGLAMRFTETSRGSLTSVTSCLGLGYPVIDRIVLINRSQVTTQTQTSLLTHMFALCLRVDRYSTDTSLIAADLSMSVPKYVYLAVSVTAG